MTIPGTFMPDEMSEMLAGFSSIKTIMIGDPKDGGKVPYYLGELIGPGADVAVTTPDGKESKLPTWAFHPMSKAGTVRNVTHIVPASHQIHAACARIHEQCERRNLTAIVGLIYKGQTRTKKGRALNDFDVFEKFVARQPA